MTPSQTNPSIPGGWLARWRANATQRRRFKSAGLGVLLALSGLFGASVLAQSGLAVVDDLLHGYPGALVGPTAFSLDTHLGTPGYSIDFGAKGGSGIIVSNANFLNFGSTNGVLSFSIWVKRDDIAAGSVVWGVSPSSSGGERGFAVTPWNNDTLYFDTDGCCDATANRIDLGIATLASYEAVGDDSWWTNWHHFVFQMNQADKQIWIDGQLFLEGTNSGALPTDFSALWLGFDPGDTDYLHGLIDDCAVYSTALSSNSINLLFTGTSPTNLPGEHALAYWSFDNPPAIGSLLSSYSGFSYTFFDTSTRVADFSTLVLTLDGQAVTPTSLATNGTIITVNYLLPNPPFASGSTHTASLTVKDTKGNSYSSTGSFVAPYFTLVPTNQLLAASAATTRGFYMETYEVDNIPAGSLANAEAILAGDFGPNVAATNDAVAGNVGANGFFTWTELINFDVAGPDDTAGDFTSPNYSKFGFPGIPGNAVTYPNNQNFVCQFFTALKFTASGMYTMGVDSQDGFRVTLGLNPFDLAGSSMLGEYDGVRTSAETDFQFYIQQPGLYPCRLLYQDARDSPATLEWFMIGPNGVSVLINDITNSIAAYQWMPNFSTAPAFVSSVTPAAGATNVAPGLVSAVIADGTNSVVSTNTVKLEIDGAAVAASVSKTNGQTTVAYVPSPPFPSESRHTATVSYTYGTTTNSYSWTFAVAIYSLDVIKKNVALLTGTAVYTPNGGGHTGKTGDYALDLGQNGTAWVTMPNAGFLNTATSNNVLSFSLWVKEYTVTTYGLIFCVSPSSSGGERGFGVFPWDDTFYFDTAGCCDATLQRIDAPLATFPGYEAIGNDTWWTNWHHIVAQFNQSDKQIWIDGQLFLEGTNTGVLPTDFSVMYLGYDPPDNQVLRGLVDDCAIYTSALGATDIAALFNGTAPTAISAKASLLAYWPFDDPPQAAAKPTLSIALVNGKVVITYTGTLQSSATVNGTYSAVAGATSPYTPPSTGAHVFYRAQQ